MHGLLKTQNLKHKAVLKYISTPFTVSLTVPDSVNSTLSASWCHSVFFCPGYLLSLLLLLFFDDSTSAHSLGIPLLVSLYLIYQEKAAEVPTPSSKQRK